MNSNRNTRHSLIVNNNDVLDHNDISSSLMSCKSINDLQYILKHCCTKSCWKKFVDAVINVCSSTANCFKFINTEFHDSLMKNAISPILIDSSIVTQAIVCLFYCLYLKFDELSNQDLPYVFFPLSSSLRFSSLYSYYLSLRKQYSSIITIPDIGLIYSMSNVLAECHSLLALEKQNSFLHSHSPQSNALTSSFSSPSVRSLSIPLPKGSHFTLSSIAPHVTKLTNNPSLSASSSVSNEEQLDSSYNDEDDNEDSEVSEEKHNANNNNNNNNNSNNQSLSSITSGIKSMFKNN